MVWDRANRQLDVRQPKHDFPPESQRRNGRHQFAGGANQFASPINFVQTNFAAER